MKKKTLHQDLKLQNYFCSILEILFQGAVSDVGLAARMVKDEIDTVII